MSGKKREEVGIYGVTLCICACILALDRLSKILATQHLLPYASVPVLKNIFHFTLVYNRGAAFGVFKNQTYLFILTALAAITFIFVALKSHSRRAFSLFTLALTLILAGAVGNLIDRLWYGYVIDFLDFRIWPVFNIADSAITIGSILLGLHLLKTKQ